MSINIIGSGNARSKEICASTLLDGTILVDAGHGHGGVGDDVAPGGDGFLHLLHCVGGKGERVVILKIRCGMDHAPYQKVIFRVDLSVAQLLGNDLKAAFFNLHWLHGLSSCRYIFG